MAQSQTQAEHPRHSHFNIGLIFFVVIFIYIVANLGAYLTRSHVSFVEVSSGQIVSSDSFTGLALRDEAVVNAGSSGYINYYVNDSEKSAKNGNVCIINTRSGDNDAPGETSLTLTDSDYSDIRELIKNFNTNFSDSRFDEAQTLDYQLSNVVNRVISRSNINYLSTHGQGAYSIMKAPAYGVVSYTIDGMENLSRRDIRSDLFSGAGSDKSQITAGSYIESGSPAYKIVKADNWEVILYPSEAQLELFKEHDTVNVTFTRDQINTTANVEVFENDGESFVSLSFSNYMVRYCNERYLDLEVVWESHKGYKIPLSSITSRDYYMVPAEYVVTNPESSEKGFYVRESDGSISFIKPNIYTKVDDLEKINYLNALKAAEADEELIAEAEAAVANSFRYLDVNDLEGGTVLVRPDTDEVCTVSTTAQLEGVYNINEGYADFRLIGHPYAYGDYCIIEDKAGVGITLYDHIVLDGSSVHEGQVIY